MLKFTAGDGAAVLGCRAFNMYQAKDPERLQDILSIPKYGTHSVTFLHQIRPGHLIKKFIIIIIIIISFYWDMV
jgi:hypothetical protein